MRSNYSYTYKVNYKNKKMSRTEKKHLTIALLVLTLAFAISFSGGISGVSLKIFPVLFGISFISVGTAFFFHEMAHRKLARDYGCWAEFRMWTWGLMMALFFSFFGFVFAAPGAVMIQGYISKEQNGKISAAGPATNWLVGLIFLIGSYSLYVADMSSFSSLTDLSFILAFVSFVNLFIGGFNLLPFGPLDGHKIFSWDVKKYGLLAVAIIGTLAVGWLLGPLRLFL